MNKISSGSESAKFEQEPVSPDFLQEQIRLPRNQWSEKFRQLFEEKIAENQREKVDEPEESPESAQERTFRRYIEGLGLDESKLRNKKVLDLGCGEGEFVRSLMEKGITSEAYGIDEQLNEISVEDKLKPYLLRGNFEEDLPVQNADYVISVGAGSLCIWAGEEEMNIRRIVEKSLASLKADGEIRMYPIQEAAKATPLPGLEASQQKWSEVLSEISENQGVEYRIEPRNIRVIGRMNDIILESVLVIWRNKDSVVKNSP